LSVFIIIIVPKSYLPKIQLLLLSLLYYYDYVMNSHSYTKVTTVLCYYLFPDPLNWQCPSSFSASVDHRLYRHRLCTMTGQPVSLKLINVEKFPARRHCEHYTTQTIRWRRVGRLDIDVDDYFTLSTIRT